VYGSDCSQWCFNGNVTLLAPQLGETNEFCTDTRGCYWRWRLSIVPCSMSMLSFDAEVGPEGLLYSQIDSAAAEALGFFCTESGSGAELQVREIGAVSPLMQWVYQFATCHELLSDLAARGGTFSGADTSVVISAQRWFGSDSARLEDLEAECTEPVHDAALGPCTQCFAGSLSVPLPSNCSTELAEACGYLPGASLGACTVAWQFCHNVCTGKTTLAAVSLGAGAALKHVNQQAAGALALRSGELPLRGRTAFALTDADSVAALDAGEARFYLAWEYREAPPAALWRADNRDGLFVGMHFAMITAAGDELRLETTAGAAAHSLGAYAWNGEQGTGIEALKDAVHKLSSSEVGWIVGFSLMTALCVGVTLVAVYVIYRVWKYHPPPSDAQHFQAAIGAENGLETRRAAPVEMSEWDRSVAEARELLRRTSEERDMAIVTMDDAEYREHEARKQRQIEAAKALVQRDYEKKGGRIGAVIDTFGLRGVSEAVKESRREFEDQSTARLLQQPRPAQRQPPEPRHPRAVQEATPAAAAVVTTPLASSPSSPLPQRQGTTASRHDFRREDDDDVY